MKERKIDPKTVELEDIALIKWPGEKYFRPIQKTDIIGEVTREELLKRGQVKELYHNTGKKKIFSDLPVAIQKTFSELDITEQEYNKDIREEDQDYDNN